MSSLSKEVDPILLQRPTINPYRAAALMVRDRFFWDLDPRSWSSRSRLRSWSNRYAGKKAVVVCNGPSLLSTDFDQLNGVFCFGLNKINLIFERSNWRPSCIVSINSLVLEQNREFFNTTDLPLFLSRSGASLIAMRPNVAFLHTTGDNYLAMDCSVSISEGYTVTVAALQLAFHMGFTDVAIVGCDHTFAEKGPANATVISGEKDASHFDPRYFSGGAKWQLPDLEASEYFYSLAQRMFVAHKRRVVNATEGGRLEVFPRMRLPEWVTT